MKNYDINEIYHPGKANVVTDTLSILSMVSIAHAIDKKNELVKDLNRLAWLGIHLCNRDGGGMMVKNGIDSSLVVEVKHKYHNDSFLSKLMDAVHWQNVEVSSQGGYGVLRLQGRLCIPDINDLR